MCDASSCTRQPPIVGDPWAVRPLTTSRFLTVVATTTVVTASGLLLTSPARGSAAEPTLPAVNVATSRVFIEGDSLTVGAATALRRRLKAQVRSVHIDAKVGRHTGEGIAKLRSTAAQRANIWVVALGTNDDPSSSQTKRNVSRVLRLAGKDRRVIWVNVVRPGGYARVNRALHDLDIHSEQLTVIDWAAVIRKKRDLLTGDRVHLTARGYRVRAEATRSAILALRTPAAV